MKRGREGKLLGCGFRHNKLHLLPEAGLNTLGRGWETTSVEAFVAALYLWKEKPPGDLGTRLPN